MIYQAFPIGSNRVDKVKYMVFEKMICNKIVKMYCYRFFNAHGKSLNNHNWLDDTLYAVYMWSTGRYNIKQYIKNNAIKQMKDDSIVAKILLTIA